MRLGRCELLILALSLILRLAVISHATWYPVSDTRDYHALAHNLVHGEGYKQVYAGETAEYEGFTFYAYRMPGYPLFLAAIYAAFGWNHYYAYLANVLCDTASQILVLLIGRRLFRRRVALTAQALFAAHVLWTPSLMTESLFTALFSALVFLLLDDIQARSTRHALLFGLLLMAALFVRPIALSVLPAALLRTVRLHPLNRSVLLVTLILIPSLLSLGLWSLRNHRVLGEFVPLSTNLGPHNAKAFGIDRAPVVLEARRQGMNEAQINRVLLRQIGAAALSSPARAIGIYVRRLVELLSLRRPWEVRGLLSRQTFTGPNGSVTLQRLYRALSFQYYATYPLALLGAIVLVRNGRTLGGVWLLITSYGLLHALVSDSNLRLAAPLYPLLCLLAAYALGQLTGRRTPQPAAVAPGLAAA